jgi:hypothetical protein
VFEFSDDRPYGPPRASIGARHRRAPDGARRYGLGLPPPVEKILPFAHARASSPARRALRDGVSSRRWLLSKVRWAPGEIEVIDHPETQGLTAFLQGAILDLYVRRHRPQKVWRGGQR